MVSKHKVLELILHLINKKEDDWQEELEKINIWDDVSFIYNAEKIQGDIYLGNIVLAFTVLAYDKNSEWLELTKNRYDDRQKIMVKLAGIPAMRNELLVSVLNNDHKAAHNLADWYLKYQKDWRWKSIITNFEYHTMTEKMAALGSIDARDAIDVGKMLEQGKKNRQDADEMLILLRNEFNHLDIALEKEGRQKITDIENDNFMNYEAYIEKRNKLRDAKKSA